MKKLSLFTFALAIFCSAAYNQSVTSLAIIPNPATPSADLKLVAVTSYPGGPCSYISSYPNVQSGNTITMQPIYCFESGSGGCSRTDTLSIGQLAAGSYTISFELLSTTAPGPCGSLSYGLRAIQQLQFTVGTATGIQDEAAETVTFFPNPVKDFITFTLTNEQADAEISIYNSAGARVKTLAPDGTLNRGIDLSNLRDGIYFYTINAKAKMLSGKLIVSGIE